MSAEMPVTNSHRPHTGRGKPKISKTVRSTLRVQKRLVALHDEIGSWKVIGERLGHDRGLLRRIALGQQKAPPTVVRALYPRKRRVRPTWAMVRAAYVAGAVAAVRVYGRRGKAVTW